MAVAFHHCSLAPLQSLNATAPSGYVIGVIGEAGSGIETLLQLAAGVETPQFGSVEASAPVQFCGPWDPVTSWRAGSLALFHTLDLKDALTRAQAAIELEKLRRAGGTALLASHDLELILWLADEVWWLDGGRLAAKGDPKETVQAYRHHIARRLSELGRGANIALTPTLRKGDGRASLEIVELRNSAGDMTSVLCTGETVCVRVVVRFAAEVAAPVVGILIRTRIGFEVFGTNTELENVSLGPCRAGERVEVVFRFPCHLCPQEYTLTVASHDPDGVWHDWMEEGLAFSVTDYRYTAGVACLRTQVTACKL